MAEKEVNFDVITNPIQEEVDTVIPDVAVPPSESTDADVRMERYKRIHIIVSKQFAVDFDMMAVLGRLGFGYRSDK